MQGVVKWFDIAKGYGFILASEEEPAREMFVHWKSILGSGYKNLYEGQVVSFTQERGDKGWRAVDVHVLSTPEKIREALRLRETKKRSPAPQRQQHRL